MAAEHGCIQNWLFALHAGFPSIFEIWCDEQTDAIIRGHTAPADDERIKAIFLLSDRLRGKSVLMTRWHDALFQNDGHHATPMTETNVIQPD